VTDETARSRGHGEAMLNWLIDYARRENCDEFHLDSGVQRFGAHRFYLNHRMFYLNHRMDIPCHHFAVRLREKRTRKIERKRLHGNPRVL
jgi:GNAT superfamily N-acetyltransferase